MERVICKYNIVPSINIIEIPKGAEILTVQVQHKQPYIWVLVDPKAETETRIFLAIKTDHTFDYDSRVYKYIGTYPLMGGEVIIHLFEKINSVLFNKGEKNMPEKYKNEEKSSTAPDPYKGAIKKNPLEFFPSNVMTIQKEDYVNIKLRDYFAVKAMSSLIITYQQKMKSGVLGIVPEQEYKMMIQRTKQLSVESYILADQMLVAGGYIKDTKKEREK